MAGLILVLSTVLDFYMGLIYGYSIFFEEICESMYIDLAQLFKMLIKFNYF